MRRRAVAVVVVGAALVFAVVQSASATVQVTAMATLANAVTIGATAIPVTLALTNTSTPFDDTVGWNVTVFRLAPSCAGVTTGVLSCTTPDSGVFALSGTGTGRAGSSCAGVTFGFGALDPAGVSTISSSSPIRFPPTASSSPCLVDFSLSVLRQPAVDAYPNLPGVQTKMAAFVQVDAADGSGHIGGSLTERSVTVAAASPPSTQGTTPTEPTTRTPSTTRAPATTTTTTTTVPPETTTSTTGANTTATEATTTTAPASARVSASALAGGPQVTVRETGSGPNGPRVVAIAAWFLSAGALIVQRGSVRAALRKRA
ncbi:MAG: hypothetical protein ACRD2W_21880 [Acidimicrobiales bacterium]